MGFVTTAPVEVDDSGIAGEEEVEEEEREREEDVDKARE